MSRMYWLAYSGTLTNAGGNADLLELNPADDKPCKLRRMVISQISEVADAAEEGLQISVQRFPATVTTGNGTAVTGTPIDSADSAAGFAAECNGATVATTSGTAVFFGYFGWNVRAGLDIYFNPEEAPKAKQAEAIIVRCDTTAADDITVNLAFLIEEE